VVSGGPLLVTDAPHLLYRAFYALPDSIKGAEGEPVNALLGSVNQTLWCVERWKPRAVVMCFGQDSADYRVEAFPAYHAHRPPMPDGLADQWERAKGLYEALGWVVEDSDDLEADDLLGSLATIESEAGGTALLFTGDRDMFQCVGDRVTVLWPAGKGETEPIGADEVRRRYGVDPEQVPDFIALRGDPSDGLPGAKGIGEKGAKELLRDHGTLEALIAAAASPRAELRPRVRAALTDDAGALRAFREIATLRHVDLERPPDAPTDWQGAAGAARERGMNRLAERLAAHEA